ncbi:hemolysin family protein [Thermodesulfovibrionales bacterium]|nr:hemolysin family protein [Thermodesulfovibrionales bacterium]
MWLEIFLISIFILINGFFAASEIAVIASRRTRIKQLIEEGKRNVEVLDNLKNNPKRFLATIQIGVTLSAVLAAAIGGALAIEVIEPLLVAIPVPFIAAASEAIAIGIVVAIITYLSLVFGELIPKSIALSDPEGVGLKIAPTIEKFSKLAVVFVKILTVSTNILQRPFGKRVPTDRRYISEEEVKLLVEEGRRLGVFDPEEKELIHGVFEFADTSVKEVMIPTPQMVSIGLNMSTDEIKAMIFEEKFSRYPVIGKDINDIRGVLYAMDFYNILSRTGGADISEAIKSPLYVPELMKISILLREMQKKRIYMAIVIDEYGAVSGLVTLEDLIEEIVGEIRDEHDTESPVVLLSDGSLIIDASLSVRDLMEDYDIEIPESHEYETMGGFILTYLQKIPQTGDIVEMADKRLKIVEMIGQRIAKVKMEKKVVATKDQ